MPIYEYRCPKCGTINVRSVMYQTTRCCACPGRAVRIFSAPAVHFKGSGFYNTDYKNKSKKDPPKDDPTPKETKEKADAGKSGDS